MLSRYHCLKNVMKPLHWLNPIITMIVQGKVTAAGTYVLKLEMSYANTIVNVSGSAIVTGLDPISEGKYPVRVENNAIIVNPGDQSVNIDIYDFSGKKIQSSYTSFIVPEGFYIIKIGNYIRKVIVRN